jgi:hypothetical protein
MLRTTWDQEPVAHQRGWYDVAAAEAALLDQVENRYLDEYQRLRKDMATMVPRKHYTDAIKSLSVCQNQIETMMLELRRLDPKNAIAGDADIVLGMLETMIGFNPDMQTDEWKADQKVKADEAEEKRRAVVQAAMWKDEPSYSDGWEMAKEVADTFRDRLKWNKDNVRGAVNKEHKP